MKAGERLACALAKAEQAALNQVLVELAKVDYRIMRQLECKFGVEVPVEELVAATRRAIADATKFDERDRNRDFAVDYEAYNAVAREFRILTKIGALRGAMRLALELMAKGSLQVEASDVGMMQEELEECLKVVIEGVDQDAGLSPTESKEWCAAMIREDRLGFICDPELQALSEQFEISSPSEF